MAPTPTHSVKHINNWKLNIYIAPSLQAQLNSRNVFDRDNARDSVCKRFKEACRARFPEFGLTRIEWGDITVTPLTPQRPGAQIPINTSAPALDDRHCCDDENCVVCDDGNHQWCRKGCTLTARR